MARGIANSGNGSIAPAAEHRTSISYEEYSLVSYLRLHPDVSKSFGIKECHGNTRVGSMLRQTLMAQGLREEWYKQLPAEAVSAMAGTNAHAASFIKKLTRRPGNRLKSVEERLAALQKDGADTAAPPDAAIKRRGKLPRVTFPLLMSLARVKRKHEFSSRGNRRRPPAAAALIERDQGRWH